jgi:hypothetical protein
VYGGNRVHFQASDKSILRACARFFVSAYGQIRAVDFNSALPRDSGALSSPAGGTVSSFARTPASAHAAE